MELASGYFQTSLDRQSQCDCISPMRTSIFAILFGVMVLAAGCVSTVDERKTAGMPFIKDSVGGRYERTVDQVANAAKQVVASNGVLVNETVHYNQTNIV